MRHRGWTARVLFLALTAMVSATVFAAAAEPGSDGDPLVTLSYLDGTYLSQILDKVDAKIAQRNAQIGVSGGTVILPESGSSAAFGLVTLSQGQTLTGDAGCEIMLRVGSAGPDRRDHRRNAGEWEGAGTEPSVYGHHSGPGREGRFRYGQASGPGRLCHRLSSGKPHRISRRRIDCAGGSAFSEGRRGEWTGCR